jgi:signal-transduction protein with cAMP-binding, CBS, and nucleotidyltransferase domain
MTAATVTDRPEESIRAAASRMWGQRTGPLVVVADGRLLGTVTHLDVLSAVARGFDVDTTKVQVVMTTPALTVGPEVPLRDAAALMAQHQVVDLPVASNGEVLGLLRQSDVLTALLTGSAAAALTGAPDGEADGETDAAPDEVARAVLDLARGIVEPVIEPYVEPVRVPAEAARGLV